MASELSSDRVKHYASIVRCVVEDTHQGFFATDPALRIVLWNRWMEIHSGLAAGDVLGQPLPALYPDVDARGLREYYQSALQGRVTILSHALHRFILPLAPTNPDAGFPQMPQSGRVGPLVDHETIVGTVTTIDDVSDRLASEAELRRQVEAQRQARDTAERALRAKDEFLSTLSHEIRTPLNAVLGWAKILLGREQVDPELLSRALQVIERNASAQARMIDDMLDMARIVAGKLRLEMQPVDALSVVLAAVDVVMPAVHAKGITLRTRLDRAAPRVFGDPDRLQQIVWNLLSNALKFTEPGGSIDVGVEASGRFVRIVVADSGRGISSEFLPFVFQRFRQADVSSGRRHGGLGLGLALVHDLVQLHGGSARAESVGEGRGATFTIELPAMDALVLRAPERDASAGVSSLAGVRVLLVEDERDARDLMITALEQYGASVTAAASTAEALSTLRALDGEALPHVIVSDIGMPERDGYDLIREVRTLRTGHASIPAIATTGYASAEDVDQAAAAGYQLHLAKPVDPAALVAAVAKLSRGRGGA